MYYSGSRAVLGNAKRGRVWEITALLDQNRI